MELGKFIPMLCVLLGLFEPSTAIDQDCNYEQEIKPGVSYYVLNPNYPNYYKGRNSCIWRTTSNSRIKLNCTSFSIPGSRNCSMDSLVVQVQDDIEYKFCGLNSFVLESVSTEMIIRFRSNYATYGGKFRCELTAIPENCECGWRNPSRIIGGVETGVNEFPMMAGLIDASNYLLYCGATIITERHVVTAAHCVYDFKDDYSKLLIVVGEHDVTTGQDTNATQVSFSDGVFIHPNYSEKSNDIAVVRSSKSFQFSMRVGPACLPYYYIDTTFEDDTLTALGWGTLWFGGIKSTTLMKVNVNVISVNECTQTYDNVTAKQICTFAKDKDACQFDSGGPMLYQNPHSNRLIFAGVISFGRTCADGYPAVNVRVTSYMDFIRSVLSGYNPCKAY